MGGHGGLRRLPPRARRRRTLPHDPRLHEAPFQRRTGDQELLLHALPRGRADHLVRKPRRGGRALRCGTRHVAHLPLRPGRRSHRQRRLRHPLQLARHAVVRHKPRAHPPRGRLGHLRRGDGGLRAQHPREPPRRPVGQHQPRTEAIHPPHGRRGDLRLLLRVEHHRIQRRSRLCRPPERNALFRRHRRTGDHRGNRIRGGALRSAGSFSRRAPRRRAAQRRCPALGRRGADARARTAAPGNQFHRARLHQRQQLHLLQPARELQRPMVGDGQ